MESSNPSFCEEPDQFLDALDAFFYDCSPTHFDSSPSSSAMHDEPSSVTTEKDVDSSGGTGEETGPSRVRVDPFHSMRNGKSGASTLYADPCVSPTWSLLGSLSRLVIRSIVFQLSLMLSFISFPSCFVSSCLAFVFDPYRTIRRGRRYLLSRVVELCDLGLEDHKLMHRLAWGLLWAAYVGTVLFAFLLFALMISGFLITHLAHQPLVIKETLDFDYTKSSPEAYVPITSCHSSCKGGMQSGKIRGLKANLPNHRTEVTVSMTLPESEYNTNLGIFQVRVDLLSASGQLLASSRRPCMIRFRSQPIRLVQTFLTIVPLVTGCISEIQTMNMKLKGFAEKDIVPTACLKIMIEQRAEFLPGAGIPEIYHASVFFESELPFLKRIVWNWRRTLFVWIGMSLFIMELLFALVFFRPLIIPRTGQKTRQGDGTSSINNTSYLDGQAGSR